MEIVDNLIIVAIPGAMDAGLDDALFWGALALALVVAFVAAWPSTGTIGEPGMPSSTAFTATATGRHRKPPNTLRRS